MKAEQMDFTSCKEAALFFARMGCSVIPLLPKKKRPCGEDILPNGWKEFQDRHASPMEIEDWFRKNPDINVGLVCGHISGIVAVDVDGIDGQKWFQENVSPVAMPNLYQTTSKSYKFHAIFRHPVDQRIPPSVKKLHDEVDIRGDGSYIVLAPSIHPDGPRYRMSKLPTFDGIQTLTPFPVDMIGENGEIRTIRNVPAVPAHQVVEGEVVQLGARNTTLASQCGSWYAKGNTCDEVLDLAFGWNRRHCQPPLPDAEVETIARSMHNTHDGNNPMLLNTGGVSKWVYSQKGEFSLDDAYQDLAARTSQDKQRVQTEVELLLQGGVIERVGRNSRRFRLVEQTEERIDIFKPSDEPIPNLWLPFRLHKACRIYPKNVIVIAGETNSGKTGLLFNFVWQNMGRHKIKYMTSEMTVEEIRSRAMKFGGELDLWGGVQFVERTQNYEDVVDPEAVNIIDYLEIYDDFAKIGMPIKRIFDKLTTGIAIIVIQKKKGEMLGRGGDFTLEKARLGISLFTHGRLPNGIVGSALITKCKNFVDGNNPDGKEAFYTLREGYFYEMGVPEVEGCPAGLRYWSDKQRADVVKGIAEHCRAVSNVEGQEASNFYDA